MNRYNLALLPTSQEVNQELYTKAKSFTQIANGYCLRENMALPHVTLCQFRNANDKDAKTIVSRFLETELFVKIQGFYLNMGQAEHHEKLWAGYIVEKSNILMNMQYEVVTNLKKKDIEVFNGTGHNYFPHFTLARLENAVPALPSDILQLDFPTENIQCSARLGLSDENGQFLKVL